MSINKLSNSAKINIGESDIVSNTVDTLLLLLPTITKSVNITTDAKIGDDLTYTCVITNIGLSILSTINFTDVLPAGCQYIVSSFKVDGIIKTPVYDSGTNILSYTIPSIVALGVTTIVFKVNITG